MSDFYLGMLIGMGIGAAVMLIFARAYMQTRRKP